MMHFVWSAKALIKAMGKIANQAIRTMKRDGKSILIMAHRPSAIQECELLLMLDGGMLRAFGPKERVLREVVQNHQEISSSDGPGGVQ